MVSTIATNEIEASAKLTSIMPPYSVNTGLIIGAFMIVLFIYCSIRVNWDMSSIYLA